MVKATAIPRTLKFYRVLDRRGLRYQGVEYPEGELIAIETPDKWILTWVVKEKVERVKAPKAGRCKRCGCTWGRACAGGCFWANEKRTVCSMCSPRGGDK